MVIPSKKVSLLVIVVRAVLVVFHFIVAVVAVTLAISVVVILCIVWVVDMTQSYQ